MIFASALEVRVTREELRDLVSPKADEEEIAILQRMNDALYTIADNYCEALYTNLEHLFSEEFCRPDYVDAGFCANASDSLMMMFLRYPEHIAELVVRMKANENTVWLEVEDNGTGIDSAVEHRLFNEELHSQKRRGELREIYQGGCGVHLYQAKRDIDYLKGRIGHINKGKNLGALFWYEVPLENLLIKP